MTDVKWRQPWPAVLGAALVVVGCASGEVSGDDGAVEAPSGSTTVTQGGTEPQTETAEWGADLDGEALCAAATREDIEGAVGLSLAAEPNPVDSQGSAMCVFQFEGGAIAEASVSPAASWEGRSPSEAYTRAHQVSASPGGTTVTELDDVGVQAAIFVTEEFDAVAAVVQTDDRVFTITTADLTELEMADLTRVLASGL